MESEIAVKSILPFHSTVTFFGSAGQVIIVIAVLTHRIEGDSAWRASPLRVRLKLQLREHASL